ncbi:methyltransferase domain-containing protein [Varunaivibrio sulfuroxidans]|uniref:Malonyl-ACP O-methyltransferase BioC n=1 Tax=Varunaivibrio sulfuroxidans TaxID=1773489 RepID=A0A4R3JG17_9PROT|nr:methyltransferase domain-containing protein [Varunaivibrio sulfuroxidans]TCS65088.1 malonyl-ACP O-methyltransferase BioC [Varunaivibrio sulfuroxidans]WES29625.1 methyltransferase domain-containing protein [Varunaivibrio sulfuroxidans]
MSDSITIFNRAAVRQHRTRAATAAFVDADFLFREVAERLTERLDDVRRSFPHALDLGCHDGTVARLLGARGDIATLVQSDLSPAMTARAKDMTDGPAGRTHHTLAADEEALPFRDHAFDLVLSNLSLHWVNDLPGALVQIRRALKPDGLFLGALLGGQTLWELREALSAAEIECEDGLSPRVSPFADVRDAGNLLTRAGFTLPVADIETITVSYRDPLKLLGDLRAMGESNAVIERRKTPLRRQTLLRAMALYQDRFAAPDGRVPATFQIIYLTAWSPSPDQPQPLARGSATHALADALSSDALGDTPDKDHSAPKGPQR